MRAWCFASVLEQPVEKDCGLQDIPEKPESDSTDH